MIYAIVAAGLVFWLRSVLGTRRNDDPPPRVNPFTVRPETTTASATDSRPATALPAPSSAAAPGDFSTGLERNMAIGSQAQQGLMDIARADASFSLPHFLRGAQDAFAMVVEAFAAGDRETLQGLLSADVYNAFCRVLDMRAQSGENASVEIHAIRRAEVVNAELDKRMAHITVKFVADETSLLRDRDGKLLAGHPERVTEAVDIWTFARDIRSREPAWMITETREGAGDQQAGSTVPDAHK
jgi:predicted lipid-binding transport protein (Tim44 family)